jgi:hypothetical protein
VEANIERLKHKYANSHPTIILEIESGNSMRNKVAEDIENLFQKFSLGFYPRGNTYIGRFPDHPITVIGSEKNIGFFRDLVDSISPYLKAEWFYLVNNGMPNDTLKLYLNGTPSFQPNGSVTIE